MSSLLLSAMQVWCVLGIEHCNMHCPRLGDWPTESGHRTRCQAVRAGERGRCPSQRRSADPKATKTRKHHQMHGCQYITAVKAHKTGFPFAFIHNREQWSSDSCWNARDSIQQFQHYTQDHRWQPSTVVQRRQLGQWSHRGWVSCPVPSQGSIQIIGFW